MDKLFNISICTALKHIQVNKIQQHFSSFSSLHDVVYSTVCERRTCPHMFLREICHPLLFSGFSKFPALIACVGMWSQIIHKWLTVQFFIQLHSQVFITLYKLLSFTADSYRLWLRPGPPEVHHHLLGLDDVEVQVPDQFPVLLLKRTRLKAQFPVALPYC